MSLTKEDGIHISKVFEDYFGNFERIDEYMRDQKLNSLADIPSNPLFPPEDDLFVNFNMHPNDMDLDVVEIPNSQWETLLSITSSHVNSPSPGRNIRLAVIEKNTKSYIGFIRLGSPIINCKPRNVLLNQVFTQSKENASRFNNSTMMGFTIVPAQPFGYNYLGGKLLAAICCSHKVREICNKKYDMNLCLFETTSLYGSTKSVSQYDGMKPFIRFKGVTDSDFLPMMHGRPYEDLVSFVEEKVGKIVDDGISSRKLKISQRIISLTKQALKGSTELEHFLKIIEDAKNLTEQKRYYVSDYGFKNYIDYVNTGNKDIWDTLFIYMNFNFSYYQISDEDTLPQEYPTFKRLMGIHESKLCPLYKFSPDKGTRENSLIPVLEMLQFFNEETLKLFKKYYQKDFIKELESDNKIDLKILNFLKLNNYI